MMVLLGIVIIATLCNPKPTPDVKVSTITPVELPIVVPGFHFPEDSNTIYSWLNNKNFPNNYDSVSVYNHVWGIWAGLTAQSGQVYQGDSLRTFETWLGITDIRNLIINDSSACAGAATKTMRAVRTRHPYNRKTPGHGYYEPRQDRLGRRVLGNGSVRSQCRLLCYYQQDIETISA